MKLVPLKIVDVVAVGFDKIGLVDADLLVVRAREVRAFHTGWFGRSRLWGAAPVGCGAVVHGHLSVLSPHEIVVGILFSHRLKKFNTVLLLNGPLEGGFQFIAIIVSKQLGTCHGSCGDGGPVVREHYVGNVHVRIDVQTTRQEHGQHKGNGRDAILLHG